MINQKMSNRAYTKIITILIVGVMALSALIVFSADPVPGIDVSIQRIPGGEVSSASYSSSLSSKSAAQVRMEVGNILLPYGIGGADINKMTDALEGSGVYKAELKSFLIKIGINENDAQAILVEFDKLGIAINEEGLQGIPTFDTEDALQGVIGGGFKSVAGMDSATAIQPTEEEAEESTEEASDEPTEEPQAAKPGVVKDIFPPPSEVSVPDTGDIAQEIDSFFDVFTELEIFVEVIAKDADITKAEARKVVDALMKVSPAFTIDENGLQEERSEELFGAYNFLLVASDANLTKADARRALDAFVGATAKSLKDSDRVALVGYGSFSISKRKARTAGVETKFDEIRKTTTEYVIPIAILEIEKKKKEFRDTAMNVIRNIRSEVTTPEERKNLIEELEVSRGTFQTEILSMSLKIRENAQELRENFRERVRTVIGHVDHGKTARIAIAHGKGLRMINRFRSATARFDHILGRIESRVGKFEARGVDTSSVIPLIEEAKNISVENEAKLEELKAKYESLLLGENPRGVAKEARVIAEELKADLQDLLAKLRAISVVNGGLELVKD